MLPLEWQQREREWLEKRLLLLPLDDHRLPGTCHARRREGDEAALSRTRARVPGRSDGGERFTQRRLHPSVEPLHAGRLEDDDARLERLHCDTRILQAAQEPFPLLLHRRRVALHEHEAGTGGKRLPQPHPRRHPRLLGGRGDGSDELLRSGLGRKGSSGEQQPRPGPQRRPELESGDDDAGNHGTYVLYERMFPCQAIAMLGRAVQISRLLGYAAVTSSSVQTCTICS